MNNLARKVEIFLIVAIIALIGIVYAFKQKPAFAPTNNSRSDYLQNAQQPIIEYNGQEGKNALELLKVSNTIEVKHYDFGDMVTGINGYSPDSKHFWAMYVNGQFSQLGASAYITKSSDTIRWEIDTVVDTTK